MCNGNGTKLGLETRLMYNCELGSPTIFKIRGWWVENELPKYKYKRWKGLTSRRQSYLQSRINKKNSKDVNYCEIYNAELGGGIGR